MTKSKKIRAYPWLYAHACTYALTRVKSRQRLVTLRHAIMHGVYSKHIYYANYIHKPQFVHRAGIFSHRGGEKKSSSSKRFGVPSTRKSIRCDARYRGCPPARAWPLRDDGSSSLMSSRARVSQQWQGPIIVKVYASWRFVRRDVWRYTRRRGGNGCDSRWNTAGKDRTEITPPTFQTKYEKKTIVGIYL